MGLWPAQVACSVGLVPCYGVHCNTPLIFTCRIKYNTIKQLLCLETEKAKQRRLDEKADEAYDELIEDMDPEDIEYMQQMNNKSK